MSVTNLAAYIAPGFEPVLDAFEENFADGNELGAGFAAWFDGELIIDITGGYADRKQSRPWIGDTIVPVYSVTKGIAAIVIAMLVDHELIYYDTPLAKYWPEFAAHGKGAVTVGEALSHQAGVPGFVEPIDPAMWLDPPSLSARLADEAPQWLLGDGTGYHPLTWGYIAGELVRRASGKTLGTWLREEICEPLQIDFQIGTPEADHHRAAEIKRPTALPDLGDLNAFKRTAFLTKWAAPDRGGAPWREAEIPSANGHGTASAVAQLYSLYAGHGKIGSRDIIGADTFRNLTKSRAHGPDRILPFNLSFAAGLMRNNNLAFGPNPNSLGHAGWGGAAAFGDPDRGLAAAYVMNRQSNILLGDPRSKHLFASLYSCL
ncbi:MAG: serine hydrolase domain-containing protein [Pseudomonadota bacterium]